MGDTIGTERRKHTRQCRMKAYEPSVRYGSFVVWRGKRGEELFLCEII